MKLQTDAISLAPMPAARPAPRRKVQRANPIARLAFGLVALMVSLVLLGDMLIGVLPGRDQVEREVRKRSTETLAVQITTLMERDDSGTLGRTLQTVLARDLAISDITISKHDGSLVMQRGASAPLAERLQGRSSTTDQLRVPILASGQPWGEILVRYHPSAPADGWRWLLHLLSQPAVQLLLMVGVGGFLVCYLYLKRAMYYLNPSASVPDRVRKAFDSLVEGLVILDQKGRVVLANRAFRELHPEADHELNGQLLDELHWLVPPAQRERLGVLPWSRTLRNGQPVAGEPLELALPAGAAKRLLISTAPVTDNQGKVRGCMVTLDNVTEIHQKNEELKATLSELKSSREKIEAQNMELRRLASRDALTGCFNRRALFEQGDEIFSHARRTQQPLACLMLDIDHFKSFNDRYGHAVGDQVIQVVARALGAGLRQNDILGRYGGEEFCIVLPNTGAEEALVVAERLRADIEMGAARAIRGVEVTPITASFGLSMLGAQARNLQGLIDQADQALYQSKRNGRNRVTQWTVEIPTG
jgi:diguanylate cyclase (GGDEF)-like protein/PAS domain S-box-containing protein